MEQRCKNCRHWQINDPLESGGQKRCDRISYGWRSETPTPVFFDERAVELPAAFYAPHDFGCVLFEAKEGVPLTWKDVLDAALEWEASNSPPWDKPVPRRAKEE